MQSETLERSREREHAEDQETSSSFRDGGCNSILLDLLCVLYILGIGYGVVACCIEHLLLSRLTAIMSTAKSKRQPDHLCVLIHGLWGNPVHLNHLRETLQNQYPEDRLHVLVAKSNSDSHTYDGIELGGERITNEIEQKIQELESNGAELSKISIAGYSLGGLIARYAIGLLYKNGVFEKLQPVNFTTFATPHLGVRTPTTGWKGAFWNNLGSRTLSTSGRQMFLIDSFRDTGRPLLATLADANSIFMRGLRMFKNKSLYANTINDRSVPFYTASFSRTDPFVDLEKVDLHFLPNQPEQVLLDPTNPVSPRLTPAETKTLYQSLVARETWESVPFYALLTVLLPVGVSFFLVNAGIQTYKSAKRVRLHEEGKAGTSFRKYRIPLVEEAQAMQDRMMERMANDRSTGGEDYLPTPPPEPASSASSSSTAVACSATPSDLEKQQSLSRQQTKKEKSHFPLLALTAEQFEMIENLDNIGITKYPVHIKAVRHTHAAIVVRTARESFGEGKVCVKHWATNFEI